MHLSLRSPTRLPYEWYARATSRCCCGANGRAHLVAGEGWVTSAVVCTEARNWGRWRRLRPYGGICLLQACWRICFFLVDGYEYSWSLCGCFGVVTVNIFSSVNKSDANVIGWIFLSNFFEWQSLAWKCTSLRVGSLQFLSTNNSQASVATHLRCGRISIYCFSRNLLLILLVKEFLKSTNIWQS